MRRRSGRRLFALQRVLVAAIASLSLVAGLLTYIATMAPAEPAEAASASTFDAGNIISDTRFYTNTDMTADEIQTFLATQVSSCNNCLRDYKQTIPSMVADSYCAAVAGSGSSPISAAQLIKTVSNACNIGSKVLLVLLQKEQSLVTAPAPSSAKYGAATGFSCPDTAPCDPTFSNFFYQVYYAARQFQIYRQKPNSFNFKGPGTYQVLYHPDAAKCGTTTVNIKTWATAGLYDYTPYTPNAAAMANLYGTGDGCSSYGNRNFWRIYTDWFGSTTTPLYISADSISARWGQIDVSGWVRNSTPSSGTAYAWINVDGVGGAIAATIDLAWFPLQFPGYGTTAGFQASIPATPGAHQVCVYQSEKSELASCTYVNVPRTAGSFDSAAVAKGGAHITGWSVDALATSTSQILVSVDGGPQAAYETNVEEDWLPLLYPGAATREGFDLIVPVPPGRHIVCAYSVDSSPLGCKTVTMPAAFGSIDSAASSPDHITVTGWFVDYITSASTSDFSIFAGGERYPLTTNVDVPWMDSYLPGAGVHQGFSATVRVQAGTGSVCLDSRDGSVRITCTTVSPVTSATRASFDSASATYGGVQVTGWAVDTTDATPTRVWVDVDGTGAFYTADATLAWFPGMFPGLGANHGVNVTVPANPGTHRICMYADGAPLGCKSATVPYPVKSSFDSATGTYGGVDITGWSVNLAQPDQPADIWVNIDGYGGPVTADKTLNWFPGLFPDAGTDHGVDELVPASPGTHQVCVYANSQLLGCRSTTVPYSISSSFDAATDVAGGIEVSGWMVNLAQPTTPADVWINVDGYGGPVTANTPLGWFPGLFPEANTNHGFETVIEASSGNHKVCVYAGGVLIACKTVTVSPRSASSVDSITPVLDGVRIDGWAVDLRTRSQSADIWIDVDGSGAAYRADKSISWFDGLYPGAGANHGISETIAVSPGAHKVCVYLLDALVKCQSITVQARWNASLDSAAGVKGGVHITGWAVDLLTAPATADIWVNVDGVGGAYHANQPLAWFEAMFPGAGLNHGFDTIVPTAPGSHRIDVYKGGALFATQTVTVPPAS